jgi:hypothetical protein
METSIQHGNEFWVCHEGTDLVGVGRGRNFLETEERSPLHCRQLETLVPWPKPRLSVACYVCPWLILNPARHYCHLKAKMSRINNFLQGFLIPVSMSYSQREGETGKRRCVYVCDWERGSKYRLLPAGGDKYSVRLFSRWAAVCKEVAEAVVMVQECSKRGW